MTFIAVTQRREGGSWYPMVVKSSLAFWAGQLAGVVRPISGQQNEEYCEADDDYGDGEGE